MANIKSIGGNPIVLGMDGLDDDVIEEFDTKADIDGYYAQLTAGAADNLTGRGDATTAEFLYRTAGGTADIETGQAVAKSIKGNTLVWNQLIQARSQSTTYSGVATVYATDGSVTFNGTSTVSGGVGGYEVPVTNGHKYLIKSGGGSTAPAFGAANTGWDSGDGKIITFSGSTGTNWFVFNVTADATYTNAVLHPQIFDLTTIFGSGNEPATVAEFEALYPEPYYPYDAESLLSVQMEGVESVGFNQWDEEWEVGSIDWDTGRNKATSTSIRPKNYIPAFPNTEYFFKCPSYLNVYCYDASKNLVYKQFVNGVTGGTFTTAAGTAYIRFAPYDTYGTTYNHDICINLSWSGRRNGEYEAFWKSQRLIDVASYFPDGMRSAGSVYDELTSTEAITRVGVVDLGTLTWAWQNTWASWYTGYIPSIGHYGNQGTMSNVCHSVYPAVTFNDVNLASSGVEVGVATVLSATPSEGCRIVIRTGSDSVTPTGILFYELKTPTVTPIDPALNLSYRVDDFGTERIMVPEDERSAPPVLDIAYGLNVVDFVRRAPTEYISHASFQQFCIALQAKLGIVITETWDDTDNRYEYSIADTVTEG